MRLLSGIFPTLLCLLSAVPTARGVVADDFPTSVRDRTGDQMVKLMQEASGANMIVADVRVTTSANQIVFHATFEKNTDHTAWLMLVSVTRQEFEKAKKEYRSKDYEIAISRSASVGGKRYYTAVWTRPKRQPRPLILPPGPIPVSGTDNDHLQPLDDMILAFLKEHNVAGATIAVAKEGRLMYARGFGYADVTTRQAMQPNDVMRIASISKPITGVAILMLVEDGKLTLDDRVVPLLSQAGYSKPTGDDRWNHVTVRHLLNHTGGWDRADSADPMFQVGEITRGLKLDHPARQKDIVAWQLTRPLNFDPGEKYAYSNFGYCVLGRVIEAVSGQPYQEFVTDHILSPCDAHNTRPGKTKLEDRGENEVRYHSQKATMHAPFWSIPPRSSRNSIPKAVAQVEAPYGQWDLEVMDAHGGWISTAPELLRFVKILDDATHPLLSEHSRTVMLAKPQLVGAIETKAFWYGCGWSVRSSGRGDQILNTHNIWHNGSLAGTSTLLVRRHDGFSWAVLFNTDVSSDGGRLSELIDPEVHRAVDSIKVWPDEDLFKSASQN